MEIYKSYVHHDGQFASIIRVSCDTDFLVKNKEFQRFCDNLAMGIASTEQAYGEILYKENPVTNQLFMEDILNARKKFDEDIRLVEYQKFEIYYVEEEVEALVKLSP